MNKKFISLLLAMVMVLGMFAGCSSETTEEDVESLADTEESSRVSMTLSLWMPVQDGTTDEAIEQVEAAINKLTQAKYDTAIELHAIPDAEYWDTVKAHMDGITTLIEEEEAIAEAKRQELKALKAQGINVEEEEEEEEATEEVAEETEEETIVNELGITIVQYPEVGEKQMDIFLVQGYENYMDLIENELIQQLDSELSGNSKILKTYIYPTYLDLANVSGTYAIPNNHPVGEYQYLLVNKELVEAYDYSADDLKTLLKCQDFIVDIGNQNLDGVIPLLSEVEPANMVYWGTDSSEWSILASQITNSAAYNSKVAPKSIFSTNVYTNTIGMMKQLKELGYIGDGTVGEGEKFAVGVISGDASVAAQYEDEYYVNIYAKPMFTEEDVYGAMFAVSTYSKSLSRSMEIITYLNTDTEFRTVMQYGVQGTHWEYEDEDTQDSIKILSTDWNVDMLDTGNAYMTYPGEGLTLDDWAAGKQQNLDSITSPYMKFTGYQCDANADLLAQLDELSKEYKERLDNLTYAEYDEAISAIKKEIKANEVVTALTDAETETSVVGMYTAWYDELYPAS